MPDYFFREGSGFSFRRRVPERLQPRIGLKEVYRTLKTTVRSEARRRAAALFLVSERLFELSEYEILSDEEIRACARRWLNMPGWRKIIAASIDGMTPAELRYEGDDVPSRLLTGWQDERWAPEQERQEQAYSALLSAGYQGPFGQNTIDRTLDELLSLLADRVDKRKQEVFRPEQINASPPSFVPEPSNRSTLRLDTPEVLKHVDEWQNALTDGWGDRKAISSHSARQYGVAVRLFTEIIGNKPVGAVSREDAALFRAQLLRLPSTHGKGGPVNALKAIEQAEKAGAERATMKTAKRHMTAMNGFWAWLKHRGHLPDGESPFSGHAFPGTKSSRRNRDDWSSEALGRLFGSGDYRTAPADSALHWLPLIALHSGMRLEEICRLRPAHDIMPENGVLCFIIQPHPDGWDPKTEAGERKVPIHSWLIAHGFLDLVAKRRETGTAHLFPEMRPNRDGKLSAEFSRDFSRLKTGLGLGPKVVFHSFRHTFRTVLESSDFQERHIDAVMGHKGAGRGEGTTYAKRVLVSKLKEVVEAFQSPLPLDFLRRADLDTVAGSSASARFRPRRGKRSIRIRD